MKIISKFVFFRKALNCIRLLTRLLPYIFEDKEWKDFFWKTNVPQDESDEQTPICLAQSLLTSISVSRIYKHQIEVKNGFFSRVFYLYLILLHHHVKDHQQLIP